MSHPNELFDDRIADWLEDDPVQAPALLLDTVLAAVPSIRQRHAARLPSRPHLRLVQLAAAAILMLLVGAVGVGMIGVPKASLSPVPSEVSLPTQVEVPLHFYGLNLPDGWTSVPATTTGGYDTFNGRQGRIVTVYAPIAPGTGQDAWAEAYVRNGANKVGGSCPGTDPSDFEPVRIARQDGLLYRLPCLTGWLALTAVGDRGYAFQYLDHDPGGPDAAGGLFRQILQHVTLDQGPTPTFALSEYRSNRYGFSIAYPTGWAITPAQQDLGSFDIPWAGTAVVDLIEGPGAGTAPGQPGAGTLDLASVVLPPGTTLDAFSAQTAIATCGQPAALDGVMVDGVPGRLQEFSACFDAFHLWVTVVDRGRGYHLVWLSDPGSEAFDRIVWARILATFRFPEAAATPGP